MEIKLINVPNPYHDHECLHHGWGITISEVSADYSPLVAVSTLFDSYDPLISLDMGKLQKISFWDEEKDK